MSRFAAMLLVGVGSLGAQCPIPSNVPESSSWMALLDNLAEILTEGGYDVRWPSRRIVSGKKSTRSLTLA
jgi:hypothetical protein